MIENEETYEVMNGYSTLKWIVENVDFLKDNKQWKDVVKFCPDLKLYITYMNHPTDENKICVRFCSKSQSGSYSGLMLITSDDGEHYILISPVKAVTKDFDLHQWIEIE